jgi:hypothetical protein
MKILRRQLLWWKHACFHHWCLCLLKHLQTQLLHDPTAVQPTVWSALGHRLAAIILKVHEHLQSGTSLPTMCPSTQLEASIAAATALQSHGRFLIPHCAETTSWRWPHVCVGDHAGAAWLCLWICGAWEAVRPVCSCSGVCAVLLDLPRGDKPTQHILHAAHRDRKTRAGSSRHRIDMQPCMQLLYLFPVLSELFCCASSQRSTCAAIASVSHLHCADPVYGKVITDFGMHCWF